MATEFTLHINIDNLPTEKSKAQEALKKATGKGSDTSSTTKYKSLAKTIGLTHLGNQIVNTAINVGKYEVSTISAKYGDTARQNEIQNQIQIMETTKGIASSIITAGIAGSAFGPIGTAAGVAISIISNTINQTVSMFERREMWNLQQSKNTINEIRSSERIGLLSTDRNRGR